MKILLACLMCLVLTMSQAFAISGGPFGGRQHVGVVGTYAGSMIPAIDPVTGLPDPNSLAVFTLRVQQAGLALGVAAIFRNGFFYPGTINASADPTSAQINGGIQGEFDDVIISGTDTLTQHYFASGTFVGAKIVAKAGIFSILAVRIKGGASITYIPGSSVTSTPPDPRGEAPARSHIILGFKQSFNTD